MPADTDMAFIIVQHLSPDYKSLMVELLSRKTKMKVLQIEDGMMVEANTVYLVPPKKNLEIYHSQLILTDQIRDTGLNLPIDIFFRSLAADKGKYAIGIILSGTGSDGTLGVKAIKEHGGLVMVQDYKDAKFDGMPKSAMSTGLVDYILEGAQMSEALVKFIKHPLVKQASKEEPKTKAETDFVKILSIVRTKVGEDFSYYKPKTIIRRIERRISVNQLHDADEYIQLLLQSPKESEILSREFLIGVTQFFRDKEAFEILEQKVIPELFKNKEDNMPARLMVRCLFNRRRGLFNRHFMQRISQKKQDIREHSDFCHRPGQRSC
jgi:two-component system CheB/CheR fusion protein